MDLLGPQNFDAMGLVLSRVVSRPAQRARARHLKCSNRVVCTIHHSDGKQTLPVPVISGPVRVSPGRIEYWRGREAIVVTSIRLPGIAGPGDTREPEDLLFLNPSRTYLLHTQSGSVQWTVPERLHCWAVDQLGVPTAPDPR